MGQGAIDYIGVKGGLDINGIIESYYVYAGENISAGDFVEFVNGVAGKVNAGQIIETSYETQVRRATSVPCNGVAKTSGIGGDETGHEDLVSIYTLGDKLSTSDGKVFMTLDNKTFLTK